MTRFSCTAALVALALASSAKGVTTFVTDRASITGGVTFELPIANGTDIQTYQSPLVVPLSIGGSATISDSINSAITVRTDDPFLENFNYLLTDTILSTGNATPLTLQFAQPISGFGTQVNVAHVGAFAARISAYDSNGALLGQFVDTGTRNQLNQGDSPFLGVVDTEGAISKIVLETGMGFFVDPETVYINAITLSGPGTGTPPPIPEPMTMGLLGIGVAALTWRLRRR